MIAPTTDDFRAELRSLFERAQDQGYDHIQIEARQLHVAVGGYPARSHRMQECCRVLREAMNEGDRVVREPPSGQGATLTIRYRLPRGDHKTPYEAG